MTLTELKYIVAVAREKHFGRAAEACFVSQPTLSVAIKKLEEELDVKLFERSANEVAVTALGEEIIRQAQSVLEQAANIKEIAKRGKDPLAGPLKLGVIYTIGPYLLPSLVRQAIAKTPQMPLMLQENFTVKLLEMLRTGEIDCAIMAEPFPDTGLATAPSTAGGPPAMLAALSWTPAAASASNAAASLADGWKPARYGVSASDALSAARSTRGAAGASGDGASMAALMRGVSRARRAGRVDRQAVRRLGRHAGRPAPRSACRKTRQRKSTTTPARRPLR